MSTNQKRFRADECHSVKDMEKKPRRGRKAIVDAATETTDEQSVICLNPMVKIQVLTSIDKKRTI